MSDTPSSDTPSVDAPVSGAMPEPRGGVMGVYDRQAERIAAFFIEGLKNGTNRFVQPWKPDGLRHEAYNPTTGKAYKGGNQIALMFAEWDLQAEGKLPEGNTDHRWLTYKQAAAIGAQVKKGEQGRMLVAWKEVEDKRAQAEGTLEGEEAKKRMIAQAFFVFHASQIDGMPELTIPPPQPLEARLAVAQRLLDESGARIEHGGNGAYYQPSTDHIQMPHRSQFTSQDAYYAVALHELGHWTGHETRLNRPFSFDRNDPEYAREELRAEMASYALSQRVGVEYDPGQHQAYVNGWIKLLEKDPREILRAANDVEKIMTHLRVPELTVEPLPIQPKEKERREALERPNEEARRVGRRAPRERAATAELSR